MAYPKDRVGQASLFDLCTLLVFLHDLSSQVILQNLVLSSVGMGERLASPVLLAQSSMVLEIQVFPHTILVLICSFCRLDTISPLLPGWGTAGDFRRMLVMNVAVAGQPAES